MPDHEYWRALADDVRARADQIADQHERLVMLEIARTYDRLAARAAKLKSQSDTD
jgi:hypothetical protein